MRMRAASICILLLIKLARLHPAPALLLLPLPPLLPLLLPLLLLRFPYLLQPDPGRPRLSGQLWQAWRLIAHAQAAQGLSVQRFSVIFSVIIADVRVPPVSNTPPASPSSPPASPPTLLPASAPTAVSAAAAACPCWRLKPAVSRTAAASGVSIGSSCRKLLCCC